MLFIILLVMVAGYAAFHFIIGGPGGSVLGALKAGYHWLLGLSAWAVFWIIWKVIWWGLVILSIDILTPPYFIDIESLFAIPIATHLRTNLGWSFGWAFGIAYIAIFALAAGILLFHWFVYRKHMN